MSYKGKQRLIKNQRHLKKKVTNYKRGEENKGRKASVRYILMHYSTTCRRQQIRTDSEGKQLSYPDLQPSKV